MAEYQWVLGIRVIVKIPVALVLAPPAAVGFLWLFADRIRFLFSWWGLLVFHNFPFYRFTDWSRMARALYASHSQKIFYIRIAHRMHGGLACDVKR